MPKILLDTNILVYSVDENSIFYQKAHKILQFSSDYAVTYSSLLEFYRVITSRAFIGKTGEKGAKQAFDYMFDRLEVLYHTPYTHNLLSELITNNQTLSGKIYDFQILAQAMENGIATLYTKNTKDFPKNVLVEIVDPL